MRTSKPTPKPTRQTRRHFLAAAIASAMAPMLARPAFALSQGDAEGLINKLTDEIFAVINSGKSENRMLRDFERIFTKYADVATIARASLGVTWRSASGSQRSAYTKAFQGYVSRKYGRQFRQFIGATVSVKKTRKTKRGFLVTTQVKFKTGSPFVVEWQVNSQRKMFDLIIEGTSMLTLERAEIGSMLDRRGGDVNKLIAHLKTAG